MSAARSCTGVKTPARMGAPARAVRATAVALALVTTQSAAARAADVPTRAPIRIVLHARAEVARRDVVLGDIALVSGDDAPTVARVAGLRIGALPGDGSSVRVERAGLARWIRARTGVEGAAIAWRGPAITEVLLAVAVVSGDELVSSADAAVREAATSLGLRADVAPRASPPALRIPQGARSVTARPVAAAALRARHVEVWVDVGVDGRLVKTVPVGVDVSVSGPAYVALRPIIPGEIADATAFQVREIEWTGRDPLPVGGAPLECLRVQRRMQVGDVLGRSHVEPVPLVRRGTWATLRRAQGRVELESPVEVLEDGRQGQSVRVRAATSSAPVVARVTGADQLEIGP